MECWHVNLADIKTNCSATANMIVFLCVSLSAQQFNTSISEHKITTMIKIKNKSEK